VTALSDLAGRVPLSVYLALERAGSRRMVPLDVEWESRGGVVTRVLVYHANARRRAAWLRAAGFVRVRSEAVLRVGVGTHGWAHDGNRLFGWQTAPCWAWSPP
jgi:hypothetical protein